MRDQAGVAADLVLAALLAVDLFDHGQWDHDLVVLEGKDRVRIMEQHVCVEDIDLFHWRTPPIRKERLERSHRTEARLAWGDAPATRVGRPAGVAAGLVSARRRRRHLSPDPQRLPGGGQWREQ